MVVDNINSSLTSYYRCPEQFLRFAVADGADGTAGYFLFGRDATCYARLRGHAPAPQPNALLPDVSDDVVIDDGAVLLPFDPCEAAANLQREIYVGEWRAGSASAAARMYYFVRPMLSVGVRRHLQKFHLRGWDKLAFPRWPVDCSVDNLFARLMLLALASSGAAAIPFIWFWPEGHSACALMTHDVETHVGRDFCPTLMDIDDACNIKASMQVVPEDRYTVTPEFLASLRARGFEVVVHDLNHDGHLYRDRAQFLERAARINNYLREFETEGFRAAVLYRKQVWYDALECSFDMSVPNVAHLDPQRGGCCTVMPYFLGDIVELPVTTIQDYTLFHILNDYSIDLWKQQTAMILEKHGLMSFIIHPDYVMEARQRQVYESLLHYLNELRSDHDVWITTPGEVNRWWRQRAAMTLVRQGDGWAITGEGSERARLAWASEREGRLVVTLDSSAQYLPGEAEFPKLGMLSQAPQH